MITVDDIHLTEEAILKGGKFILADVQPIYESVDALPTENRLGTNVTVALTAHQLKKMVVSLDDVISCQAFHALELAEVRFEGFDGFFVWDATRESYELQGTASRLYLVN